VVLDSCIGSAKIGKHVREQPSSSGRLVVNLLLSHVTRECFQIASLHPKCPSLLQLQVVQSRVRQDVYRLTITWRFFLGRVHEKVINPLHFESTVKWVVSSGFQQGGLECEMGFVLYERH
jgi:hypothetical protein